MVDRSLQQFFTLMCAYHRGGRTNEKPLRLLLGRPDLNPKARARIHQVISRHDQIAAS